MFNRKKAWVQRGAVVFVCMAVIFQLTACQKSPESSIVVNKDLDKLIEQAEDTSRKGIILNKEYDRWQKTIEDEKLRVKVNVDAGVYVPQTEKMSIFRVSQQKISQELLDEVRTELVGDTALYDGAALKVLTKSDIEKEIARRKEEMGSFDENDPDYGGVATEFQKRIDALEEQYNSAPSELSFEGYDSDGKLQSIADQYHKDQSDEFYKWIYALVPEGDVYYGVSDGSDGNYISLYAVNSENYSNYISFRRDKQGYEHMSIFGCCMNAVVGDMMAGGSRKEITDSEETSGLTMETAVGVADEFLENVGINDGKTEFRYYDGELVEEKVVYESESEDGETSLGTRNYYILSYTRYLDGAFVTSGGDAKGDVQQNGDSYKKLLWPTEKMEFRIDNSGIVGFDYMAPIGINETVVEKSSMKTFEEVRDTFSKMIVVTNADEYSDVQMEIDRITLGYAMVSEQGRFDTGLLVPVWDFIGTKRFPGMEEQGEDATQYDVPCLTINAIDGSVINRRLGY